MPDDSDVTCTKENIMSFWSLEDRKEMKYEGVPKTDPWGRDWYDELEYKAIALLLGTLSSSLGQQREEARNYLRNTQIGANKGSSFSASPHHFHISKNPANQLSKHF